VIQPEVRVCEDAGHQEQLASDQPSHSLFVEFAQKPGAVQFHRAGGCDCYACASAVYVMGRGGEQGKGAREDEDGGSVKARRPQDAAEDL
jgi:hypothetical protein